MLMSFLNFTVELAITTSAGSAFQIGIIRVEKKYFLTSFLAILSVYNMLYAVYCLYIICYMRYVVCI